MASRPLATPPHALTCKPFIIVRRLPTCHARMTAGRGVLLAKLLTFLGRNAVPRPVRLAASCLRPEPGGFIIEGCGCLLTTTPDEGDGLCAGRILPRSRRGCRLGRPRISSASRSTPVNASPLVSAGFILALLAAPAFAQGERSVAEHAPPTTCLAVSSADLAATCAA